MRATGFKGFWIPPAEEIRILAIIGSYCLNYPVLYEWGYVIGRIIVILISGDGSIHSLLKPLKADVYVVDSSTTIKACKEELCSESKIICMDITGIDKTRSDKTADKAKLLINLAREGTAEGFQSDCVPLFICRERVPDLVKECSFVIHMDNTKKPRCAMPYKLIPGEAELELVKDKAVVECKNISSPEKRALLAAACCICPTKDSTDYSHLATMAGILCERDENSRNTEDLADQFIRLLINWWDSDKRKAYFVSDYCGEEDLSEVIFCETYSSVDYIDLTDSLFREIATPLTMEGYNLSDIKRSLANREVLVSKHERLGDPYTSKVTLKKKGISNKRVYLIRLVESKVFENSGVRRLTISESIKKEEESTNEE